MPYRGNYASLNGGVGSLGEVASPFIQLISKTLKNIVVLESFKTFPDCRAECRMQCSSQSMADLT